MPHRSTRSKGSLRSKPGGLDGVEARRRQCGRARSSGRAEMEARPAGSGAGLPRDTVPRRARMLLYLREMNRSLGPDGRLRLGHTILRCVHTRHGRARCVGAADLEPETSSPQKQAPGSRALVFYSAPSGLNARLFLTYIV